ncbi:MAG: hypothetical protein ACK41W_17890, partial [Cyanobacteriota bacterium]
MEPFAEARVGGEEYSARAVAAANSEKSLPPDNRRRGRRLTKKTMNSARAPRKIKMLLGLVAARRIIWLENIEPTVGQRGFWDEQERIARLKEK